MDVPEVYFVDKKNRRFFMERVRGTTVKDYLLNRDIRDDDDEMAEGDELKIARQIGTSLAVMHDMNVIHGDLTTSNMMIRAKTGSIVFIDFGLGSIDVKVETKAVDLYVLERAFVSTHPDSEKIFEEVLKAYASKSENWKKVSQRFEKVRMRGRKRT